MITQKHGRKLASQLGEVLFVCQFYDLQIEMKVSLSLRNLWLHLVQMCVCPSSPQRHYTAFSCFLFLVNVSQLTVKHKHSIC